MTPAPLLPAKCPTRKVMGLLSDKWGTYTLALLGDGKQRFSFLLRNIEGVSQKMLTQTLRRQEQAGLLTRTVHATVPPVVEYELTELGHSLLVPLTGLRAWAEGNHQRLGSEA